MKRKGERHELGRGGRERVRGWPEGGKGGGGSGKVKRETERVRKN